MSNAAPSRLRVPTESCLKNNGIRIELAPRNALVISGVGEREIADCQGAIDGLAAGPQVGDIGDWHAAAKEGTAAQGGTSQGGATQGAGGATATQAPGRARRATPTPPANPPGSSSPPTSIPPAGETPLACVLTETNCGGVCVNLSSDAENCGACGNVCATDQVCQGGVCTALPQACLGTGEVCVDPTVCCSGLCNPDGFCA